mmetsp:Transcript_34778/g.88082  ORF Transcript_34778/g.88082 Transcript_34778/m.88082 type:complete len:421 (-) Transcript_34778:340-1602(-)|eukprot:CAMPEP_0202868290 /NCGR_PEP_ID=MMETSP1391-20130828/10644_1 /ASSEMBLY_ACC=CAM_ASM_000867 /TAXON_ID=1034604 /ORGANISM="Chlamydomonas leiostraca, Strain SAG 11-49" /LENGTH=420 /DNA_ID=CAMNT_0049548435 /DNA_START=16 /DNA_END=1278 /DNA_ORIENTATION=+
MAVSTMLTKANAGVARPQANRSVAQPKRVSHIARAWNHNGQEAHETNWLSKAMLSVATASVVGMSTLGLQFAPPAEAKLTAGDPIKNAQAILRYALPIDNKPIREVQRDLESIAEALRIPGSKSLGPVARSVRNAQSTLKSQRAAIVAAFAPDKKAAGTAALEALDKCLEEFTALIDAKDKQAVPIKQREALGYVSTIEESMVKGFPFTVPAEYSQLPQLLGRATLQARVALKDSPDGAKAVLLTIVLDGYNAPVSAGGFMDLVNRGFYDGMEIQRADGFVVQTGDPDGPADGFVDPGTGALRTLPMEVRVSGDKEPIYEFTLEDLGRVNEQPVLPFNAYGTLAWARNEFENNSASSQVFFLLKESELTPSGANLLDGRFAVFGYVTEGQDALGSMKVGDKIEYIKVLSGNEFLKNGAKP